MLLAVAAGWLAAGGATASLSSLHVSGSLMMVVDGVSFPTPEGAAETVLFLEASADSLEGDRGNVGPAGDAGTAPGTEGGASSARRFRVTVVLRDLEGNLLARREQELSAAEPVGETAGEEGVGGPWFLRFRLPPGRAQGEVRLEEGATGRTGRVVFDLDVPSFGSSPVALSDLVFGSCREAEGGTAVRGWKGNLLPRPDHRYDEQTPAPCVYALVTDTASVVPASTYRVRVQVQDSTGRVREKKRWSIPRESGRGEVWFRPRVDGYPPGRYRVEVQVSVDGKEARRSGVFTLAGTPLSFARDADMIETVLAYVATNAERIELERAPKESLRAVFDRFWARRDPTPGTRRNEALAEFLKRVDYARRHFGGAEPGWRSDMGRIYIRFGPPDRVEERRAWGSPRPIVVWHYASRNATFVFRDRGGFGRYRLEGTRRD